MKVKLFTRECRSVARECEISSSQFVQRPPEVITWGARVFVQAKAYVGPADVAYVEGTAYQLEVDGMIPLQIPDPIILNRSW